MKIEVISDTHGQHRQVELQGADVLIHCGDITGRGEMRVFEDFCLWLEKLPHKDVIIVAGNHDFNFENVNRGYCEQRLREISKVHYLYNDGIELGGVKFWGSPNTPEFMGWAFMREEEELADIWELIPTDTQVLITHGPPKGILDKSEEGEHCGSVSLRDRLANLNPAQPIVHVFGHIHEDGGKEEIHGNVTHINASVLDRRYKLVRKGTIIDL